MYQWLHRLPSHLLITPQPLVSGQWSVVNGHESKVLSSVW